MGLPAAVGVDIGGTYTKIALVQADGTILRQERIPTGSNVDPGPYLVKLKDRLRDFAASQPAPLGIGLGLPGFLSPDRHSILYNPNTPALLGIDFASELAPLGLPIAIEQDLNIPALAEYHLGAGRGSRRFMTGAIGTGLGAAVIIDGELVRFAGHTLGDSGHIILDPDGPTCTAGCHGCAEALTAIPGVERAALRALDDPRAGPLRAAMVDGRVPARAVIQACQQGDPLAVEIMSGIGRWLGQWIASLTPMFFPDLVVLCGGIAEAGEPLLAACRARFYALAGQEYARCEIAPGQFKGLAGVIGSAVPFFVEKT